MAYVDTLSNKSLTTVLWPYITLLYGTISIRSIGITATATAANFSTTSTITAAMTQDVFPISENTEDPVRL